jgi:hypothetical protein
MIRGVLFLVPRIALAIGGLAVIVVAWPVLWWLDTDRRSSDQPRP